MDFNKVGIGVWCIVIIIIVYTKLNIFFEFDITYFFEKYK